MAPYRPGPSWPKIKRRLRGYKNELVQLLRELTAIPALGPENGGEGEQAKARYLLQVMVSAVSRKTGARITYEVVNAVQAPPPTSLQAPVVRALQEAIRAVYRKEACARGIGGATVAAFFRARRLPAAVWMTTLETAHQPNETARLSRMIGDAQVLAHIFCQN